MTFHTISKYLGLTAEVLRTEKAINDIACHPLPASFYEGGGLQYLRQRFDASSTNAPDIDDVYFNHVASPTSIKESDSPIVPNAKLTNSPVPIRPSPFRTANRHQVQAGDLHSSTGSSSDIFRPLTRSYSILNTPRMPRLASFSDDVTEDNQEAAADFDLREEVMSCIAKSIGLLQPPLSGGDSVEASPAFPSSEAGRASNDVFNSSFGSLSLLDLRDDSSSMTGGSSSMMHGGYMSGLDNEVEILFFAAGSTLARAGERNTGFCSALLQFVQNG